MSAGQPRERHRARLEHFPRSSGAVGHDDDAVAPPYGSGQGQEPSRPSAARRPSNGDEPEAAHEIGHHRAVFGAADQDPEPARTIKVWQQQEPRMPDDVYQRRSGRQERLDSLFLTLEPNGGRQETENVEPGRRRDFPAEPGGRRHRCAPLGAAPPRVVPIVPATSSTARAARSPTPGLPNLSRSSLKAARWAVAATGSTRMRSTSAAKRAAVASSCRISGTTPRPATILGRLIQGERVSSRAIASVSFDTR